MRGGKLVMASSRSESARIPRIPRFFKVMFGDFGRRMRIPRAFLPHLLEESPDVVDLEGPGGDVWHVKLKRTKDDIFLEQGWEAFKEDHSLVMGDVLIFEYDGKKHLHVTQILSIHGCLREDAFAVKCSLDLAMSPGNERHGSDVTEVEDRQLDCVVEPNLSMALPDQLDPIPLSNQVTESRLASPTSDRLVIDQGIGPGPDPEAAALLFASSFPNFMIQMKSYNVSEPYHLQVPTQFSKEHLPSVSKRMHLQNLEGMRWSVRVLPKSSTKLLTAGFRNFSRDNNLQVGDCCVFELIKETELKVHVFRRG